MKVSFLVTFYNQEEFVAQALDSILAIDKPCDWEILIGDDGSSDGTVDVVNEYIKEYPNNIFLHIMPRDQSKKYNAVRRLGANKLNLLKHTTGDFFCNLDGDDVYCDVNFVKEALQIYEKTPGLSVVAFGFQTVVDGVVDKRYVLPKEGIISTSAYLRSLYTHVGSCVLLRICDKERMDYIASMGYYDDNVIVANNLNYGCLYAVKRPVYGYYQTPNSIMTSMKSLADQAVHNCQGCDIDIKLVPPNHQKDVLKRYSHSILYLYLNKNKIDEIIGRPRYEMYLRECKEIDGSLTYKLLTYRELDKKTRRAVNKKVYPIAMYNWRVTLSLLLKIIKRDF